MSARTGQVLARFPAHFEAARPGKELSVVVDAIASDLDVLSADLAAVRRAHRIGNADTLRDVLLLGGLHGLDNAILDGYRLRSDAELAAVSALEQAEGGAPADLVAAAESLLDLWGIDEPAPRLALFAPAHDGGSPPDLPAAAKTLASLVRARHDYPALVEAARERVVDICGIHHDGNGTVRALLRGACSALGLTIDDAENASVKAGLAGLPDAKTLDLAIDDDLFHSVDHFWHATFVRDRTPLTRIVPTIAPAKVIVMADRIAASEIADQAGLTAAAVLAAMAPLPVADVREGPIRIGGDAAKPESTMPLADALLVAAALGFEVQRYLRGTIQIERTTTAGELAGQLGIRVADCIARLAAIGVAGATPSTVLEPEVVAPVARVYGYALLQRIPTQLEALGIEENPLRRETYKDTQCAHTQAFTIARRGFGREPLRVEVIGTGDHTFAPMLVNRDEGRGVGYFGSVPDGSTLQFNEDGRVTLDAVDVTGYAYSWTGACFADPAAADGTPLDPQDFQFDGPGVPGSRRALFVVTTPAGAFDRDYVFPHADIDLTVPGIGLGVTRFAFFIQEAHASSRDGTADAPVIRRVTPRYAIGFFDQSVFAPPPPPRPVAATLRLSWLEHEAYALRVVVPQRFSLMDGAQTVASKVRDAIERFRPAGVDVRVEYEDDRWVLGTGVVVSAGAEDPIAMLRGGTELWPAPVNGG